MLVDLVDRLKLETCWSHFHLELREAVFVLLLQLSSMSLLFLLPSVLMGCALMYVDDEAHCLSSRFWFAMLEGSLGLGALCVGFVFFSLGINA